MTPQQIELVQSTWRKVLPVRDTAAELFYGKLFSLDASLRALFKDDLQEQGRNLAAMISIVVSGLSHPERILRAVKDLGRRHAAYGVKARHYELVAVALLWMLEQCLGEAFTAEARDAWTGAYQFLAGAMQEASCASA